MYQVYITLRKSANNLKLVLYHCNSIIISIEPPPVKQSLRDTNEQWAQIFLLQITYEKSTFCEW